MYISNRVKYSWDYLKIGVNIKLDIVLSQGSLVLFCFSLTITCKTCITLLAEKILVCERLMNVGSICVPLEIITFSHKVGNWFFSNDPNTMFK